MDLEGISKAQHKWEDDTSRESVGADTPEAETTLRTGSGDLTVKQLYTPLDMADKDYLGKTGFPGQYPFTRGVDPDGARARRPLKHFYSGFGGGEDAAQRYKALVAAGADRLSIALDLPTQLGYDSDHPLAKGEVGKVGVAIDSLRDIEVLLEDIPLDKIALSTVANCIGPWFLALFVALIEKRGLDPNTVRIQVQNDPIKEYTGRGTYIFPVGAAIDLASDVVQYCRQHLPNAVPQYACSTQFRCANVTAAQEIGFGLAFLMAYVEAAQKKGVAPEEIVPKMNLHMVSDNDLFEEAAKFRATRRLWADVARRHFHTDDPRVLALAISVFAGGHRLAAQQPLNNVVRTTMHVLAAMLGGAQWLLVPAYDEALALPTLESTRLANLTQEILHFECMVDNTVDPLGGSYYLETLTDQLEQKGREWYDRVIAMGGAVAAIESGFYLQQSVEAAYKYQREVATGKRTVIGVNKYVLPEEVPQKVFRVNPEAERKQIERLTKLRAERASRRVLECLGDVKQVAQQKKNGADQNIVPPILEAVRTYATVGEIFGTLRGVFGEYRPWRT